MKKISQNFFDRLQNIYNQNDINIIKNGLNTKKRKTSFRINTIKSNEKEILEVLNNVGLKISKINFIPNAYILENGKESDLWNLDIFKEGKIYIQSISSQIPAYYLDIHKNMTVLDVTAAPGSKTSQIGALLNNTGKIIANDNNTIRLEKLKFTINRQGCKNIEVIKNDAKNLNKIFKNETFDIILADLPCSAEGRINLNIEKSYGFWSEENILKNQKNQNEILKTIIPLLKKDGILVYSTCTIAPEENEEIVDEILKIFPNMKIENINLDYNYIRQGITSFNNKNYSKEVSKSIRCLPSEETEGFYIAKFRKL